MARHGGGHVYSYSPAFFSWVRVQLLMIEDYAYSGTNFWNDPDLALPPASHWDVDLGKTQFFFVF